MTARPVDDRDEAGGPVPVARGITALLRSLPGPDTDDAARAGWLAAKADLFDRISAAAATRSLAEDAAAAAHAARSALAGLTKAADCTGTGSSTSASSTTSTAGTTSTGTTSENATTTSTGGAL